MAQTIEGKIAKILSDTLVIVNLGAMHGIRLGTIFTILAEGDEVTDPDSGEVLGNWEVPKGHVVVTNVQDRLCTCEAYEKQKPEDADDSDPTTRVLSADMIRISMRPESLGTKHVKLNVNRNEVSGLPRIGPIQVGDKVRATIALDESS